MYKAGGEEVYLFLAVYDCNFKGVSRVVTNKKQYLAETMNMIFYDPMQEVR